ncbi:MAG: hypothetical protein U9N07_02740, partial [Euryarchaeota archaeon]|nr:hypothetical protein [Euryarchaeota archaeon]
ASARAGRKRCQTKYDRYLNCGMASMPGEPAEPVQVEFTPEFKRNLRVLARKYRHILSAGQRADLLRAVHRIAV